MDYDKEIRILAGENLALQSIVVALCARLAQSGLREHVASSFDAAASFIEDRAIALGKSVPSDHLVHSLKVVEDLRAATLGDKQEPHKTV